MGGYIRVRFGFRRPWSFRLRSPPAAPEMRRSAPICAVFTLENKCAIIAILMHLRRRPGDKAPTNSADRPTDDRRPIEDCTRIDYRRLRVIASQHIRRRLSRLCRRLSSAAAAVARCLAHCPPNTKAPTALISAVGACRRVIVVLALFTLSLCYYSHIHAN